MSELCDLSLAELARLLQEGRASAVEISQAYLDRISCHDLVLRAFITVAAERAMRDAKRADSERAQGRTRGSLHGVPVAIKDLIAVAGLPLTGGSKSREGRIADADAHVVERLNAAGAVILGKLSTHEFGIGRSRRDGPFATGRNPWNVGRVTTGSSSGAGAAVAAGMCACAIGTDTGGSIRLPSAYCGLTGLKPTFGLVSRRGVIPMSWSLDHVGPIARTARDLALLLGVIAGPDSRDPWCLPDRPPSFDLGTVSIKGLRLGLLRRYYLDWPGLDQAVRRAALAAFDVLRGLDAQIVDVDLPMLDLNEAIYTPFMSEAYAVHQDDLRRNPGGFDRGTRTQLYMGALFSAEDYIRAQRLRARFAAEVSAAFVDVDALIFPGQLGPPPEFSDEISSEIVLPRSRFTRPWNLVGNPAISVPSGFDADGLPLSIQLVGPRMGDVALLRIAAAYQEATDWHERRPDPAAWGEAASTEQPPVQRQPGPDPKDRGV